MTNLYLPRDWLDSVPEFDASTDEDDVNIMSFTDGRTQRFRAVDDDWADRYED